MHYVCLALLITGSAMLVGCGGDDDNGFNSQVTGEVAIDQAKAVQAVSQVEAVIAASRNLDTDEPQDISHVVLAEANLAEPIKINNTNASL